MSAPMERIQVLDTIEKDIITCLQCAGQALLELSKEKSSQKQAETNTSQFLRTLDQVERKLSEQINYLTQVSTGQPHEGSGYASQKVLQMAWHRLEHVRSWVNELDRLKAAHLAAASRPSTALPPAANSASLRVPAVPKNPSPSSARAASRILGKGNFSQSRDEVLQNPFKRGSSIQRTPPKAADQGTKSIRIGDLSDLDSTRRPSVPGLEGVKCTTEGSPRMALQMSTQTSSRTNHCPEDARIVSDETSPH